MKGTNKKGIAGRFENFSSWYENGYPSIYVDGKVIRIHAFVWERIHGSKPNNMIIHHIDGDKSNYDINNLELLSKSAHRRIHNGWVQKDNQWVAKSCTNCGLLLPLSEYYLSKGHYTPLCKKCHNLKKAERQIAIKEIKGE
jgi:hypothetical protein